MLSEEACRPVELRKGSFSERSVPAARSAQRWNDEEEVVSNLSRRNCCSVPRRPEHPSSLANPRRARNRAEQLAARPRLLAAAALVLRRMFPRLHELGRLALRTRSRDCGIFLSPTDNEKYIYTRKVGISGRERRASRHKEKPSSSTGRE